MKEIYNLGNQVCPVEMKFLVSTLRKACGISRVLYSTKTLTSDSRDSLYSRIMSSGDKRVSIIPVLNQWVEETTNFKHAELPFLIKRLRKTKRFKQALEISEWMSDQRDLSPGDVAIQLDLISKVRGLDQAEKYFSRIPDSLKLFQVYGALLNCYAHYNSLEKAEAIMQKMQELGFSKTVLSCNVMLNLYLRMGKHEKLDSLIQEMEAKGIERDMFTYNICLNAYAAAFNVEGMKKFLENMETDPLVTADWHTYVIAANGYLKAGLVEQASVMLKKSEHRISFKDRKLAYEILLTLYTAVVNKDVVYRIWNLYKKLGKFFNTGYLCMMQSLVKLDDIDGAEKIFEEWESGYIFFDIQVLNVMISAYCSKGLLNKAEECVNNLIENGEEPAASTWGRLATGYNQDDQMGKAVELMKKAILASGPDYKPNRFTLAACIEYLKGEFCVAAATKGLALLLRTMLTSAVGKLTDPISV